MTQHPGNTLQPSDVVGNRASEGVPDYGHQGDSSLVGNSHTQQAVTPDNQCGVSGVSAPGVAGRRRARPDGGAVMDELIQRLETEERRLTHTLDNEELFDIDWQRLWGKREGIRLALSYAREMNQ